MYNHVALLGRLAQDPELRQTQSGKAVTSFDLAVPVPSSDRDAPPDYIPIVCWGQTAEFASRYFSKGRQIVVEGRIGTRRYTDKGGNNRKEVEVKASRVYFADSKNGGGESAGNDDSYQAAGFETMQGSEEDDLPF